MADMGSVDVLVNVTANHYKHSFESVQAAMRLVREGKRHFFTQYLLNPSAESFDICCVVVMFFILCGVRFVLAGAHHPRTRNSPSIFRMIFGKFSKPKRESKLCENLWWGLYCRGSSEPIVDSAAQALHPFANPFDIVVHQVHLLAFILIFLWIVCFVF